MSSILLAVTVTAQTTAGHGDYVLVPEGPFQMGDNYNEGASHETPVHTVYLGRYYIARYAVTNAEYGTFIAAGGYANPSFWVSGGYGSYGTAPQYWNDPKYKGGGIPGNENFPVVGVSWYEASAYCRWLSLRTGQKVRLPTEAEWEKAARGTDQRRFPWGNDLDGSYANYDNSGDIFDNLTPVSYYDGRSHGNHSTNSNASPYGAVDMAGNVWNWCSDWYDAAYYSASPARNPAGPVSGKAKVIRGGSWRSVPATLRSSYRGGNDAPASRTPTLGFRCAKE